MRDLPRAGDPLFGTRWVHVFEQDTPDGQVFLPDSADIPLSRRPRTRLELLPDGTGTWYQGGPDDRPVGQPVTWRAGEAGVVVERRGGAALRIVSRAPDRIVVAPQS